MEHQRRTQVEFTRQAEAFAASPALRDADVTEHVAAALGDARARRLLDVACGPGMLSPLLAQRARQVVGLDLTAEVLRLGRARCREAGLANVGFVRALVERPPFAAGGFDAAVLRLALHHFEAPKPALAGIRALLRPGGRLVLLDLLTSPDAETARLRDAIERLRDPSHRALQTEVELHTLLREAGFEIETSETWRKPREFREWARIVSDPVRTDSLEVLLRHLARAGISADVDLREVEGELWLTYTWCLVVARAGARS